MPALATSEVDAARALDEVVDGVLDGHGIRDVAGQDVRRAAEPGDLVGQRLQLVGRPRGEADRRAARGQSLGKCAPDPARRTGHERSVPAPISTAGPYRALGNTMAAMATEHAKRPRRSTSRRCTGSTRPASR